MNTNISTPPAAPELDTTCDGHSDDSHSDDSLVEYPSISEVLQELHTIMPAADMLIYETGLVQYGVVSLNKAEGLDPSFLRDEVGMPMALVWPFKEHIRRLLRQARKGKGCEIGPKEGDENNHIRHELD